MLEFGIGLGWLGWECQNYLWMAGVAGTAPATPTVAAGLGKEQLWEHPELLLLTPRLPKLGKKSCKKSFSARGSGSLPSPQPRSVWGFPAQGLEAAP